MTGKATTVFLVAVFASQVALTAVSFADGKKGRGGTSTTTVIGFKAKLAPPTTVAAADLIGECEGQANYKNKTTTKISPTPSTSIEESFSGEVECPFLVVDEALAAVYDMHLARGAVDYAFCTLAIKEIEFEYQSGNPPVLVGFEGEYAVKVSQKTVGTPPVTTLKQKVGGCTDAVGGTTQLVPAVQDKDTVAVFMNGGSTLVLSGVFGPSSGSDDDD